MRSLVFAALVVVVVPPVPVPWEVPTAEPVLSGGTVQNFSLRYSWFNGGNQYFGVIKGFVCLFVSFLILSGLVLVSFFPLFIWQLMGSKTEV